MEEDFSVVDPKWIAQTIHRSVQWVYSHASQLGGVKIGGSWLFTKQALILALIPPSTPTNTPEYRYKETPAKKHRHSKKRFSADYNTDPSHHGIADLMSLGVFDELDQDEDFLSMQEQADLLNALT